MAPASGVDPRLLTGTDEGTLSRQAVVVIHGMGEQQPLETLRGFVETVYQRDVSEPPVRPIENDPDLGIVNQVFAVPDDATGTAELRRISTPPDEHGRRTDFFEFYWADIMEGTPIEQVWSWVRGLLLRSPFAVPRSPRVWIAWILLWLLAIAVIVLTIATLDPTDTMIGWIGGPFRGFGAVRMYAGYGLGAIGLLLGVVRFATSRRPARVAVTMPLVLMVAGLLVALLPAEVVGNAKVWSAVIAAAMAALFGGIVAPYAGDIVRYVRAAPETVGKRAEIRQRGLKLLTDLHADDPATGAPVYDRIVIVAHSLGTIIAYDLIQLLWQQEGPTHHKPPLRGAGPKAALEALDAHVKACWFDPPTGAPFALADYRETQAAVATAIAGAGLKFRITDFITLGAALNHADFLLAPDGEALDRRFVERYLSASPPRPDGLTASMIYDDWDIGAGTSRGPFIHFASPFAAVRWTNIYDEHVLPLLGDIVSGPLAPLFGPGIDDRNIAIVRPRWPPVINRFFTHTRYWTWDESYRDGPEPAQFDILRRAIFQQ